MPSRHDLHRMADGINNPFEDAPQRISEYTARQIATLQSKLEKQLGPEFVSTRAGPGGSKVHYLTAEKAINLANDVFGFNGWSTEIRQIQVDFVDEAQPTGKISLGISCILRVTLKDGTFHEDLGYGDIDNAKNKAAAFMKAKKEAVSDALKRALRNFGNVMGNCLYDKNYVQKVTRIKAPPAKFDPDDLYRPGDRLAAEKQLAQPRAIRPVDPRPIQQDSDGDKKISADFEDDFEGGLFEGVEFDACGPDAVFDDTDAIDFSKQQAAAAQQAAVAASDQRQGVPQAQTMPGLRPQGPPAPQRPAQQPPRPIPKTTPAQQAQGPRPGPGGTVGERVGFVSSRAAELVQERGEEEAPLPPDAPAFNPHQDSPMLRRTGGVDHNKSMPINRGTLAPAAPVARAEPGIPPAGPNAVARGSFVNPQSDVNRRIGMPAAIPSPLANRGGYRPPAMQKRAALSDVSNLPLDGPGDPVDFKRQRIDG